MSRSSDSNNFLSFCVSLMNGCLEASRSGREGDDWPELTYFAFEIEEEYCRRHDGREGSGMRRRALCRVMASAEKQRENRRLAERGGEAKPS